MAKKCKTGAGFIPGVPLCLQCGDDCQCFGCREADAKRKAASA